MDSKQTEPRRAGTMALLELIMLLVVTVLIHAGFAAWRQTGAPETGGAARPHQATEAHAPERGTQPVLVRSRSALHFPPAARESR